MDQTTQMKLLLEAVKAPEVDKPKATYSNTPGEQTLDSATQQNFGDDLHKKKPAQYKQKAGDNARADKTELEEALTAKFNKFKLNESALRKGMKWDTRRELADLIGDALREADLDGVLGHENFNEALRLMWEGDWNEATDYLMQYYTGGDGGEPRNWQAIADDLADNLEYIATDLCEKQEAVAEELETAGDSAGESATLKDLHDKGADHLDGVTAKVFGPTDAYPAPWKSQHVGGKYPIYAIKASNGAEVATWLNQTQAEKVISEIS